MSNPATAQWPRTVPRLDSQVPYLRILFVTIYIRDVDRSIRFYVDQLGFNLLFDSPVGNGRFVVVGPPDGSAISVSRSHAAWLRQTSQPHCSYRLSFSPKT